MGKVCIEGMRQPDFAIAQLAKVAVGKNRIDQITEQPKIHIGAQRFDAVESQRRPVWHIDMKQPDAGIDAGGKERDSQLGLAHRI